MFTTLGYAEDSGCVHNSNKMYWGQETRFSREITVQGNNRQLEGHPDYSLWYGHQQDMETNLVVVEAKTTDALDSGLKQLLAYMGKF